MSYPYIRIKPKSFWNSWSGLCFAILLGALLFFLFTEHTAHTLGILPYAIFLLCPIMHLFMHRGLGHSMNEAEKEIEREHAHKEHQA